MGKNSQGPIRRVQSNDIVPLEQQHAREASPSSLNLSAALALSTISSSTTTTPLDTKSRGCTTLESPKRGVRRCPSHTITIVSSSSSSSSSSDSKTDGSKAVAKTTTTTISVLRRGVKRSQSASITRSTSNLFFTKTNYGDGTSNSFSPGSKLLVTALMLGVTLCLLEVVYIINKVDDTTAIIMLQQQQRERPSTVLNIVRNLYQGENDEIEEPIINVPVIVDDDHNNNNNNNKHGIGKIHHPVYNENTVLDGFTEGGKGPIIALVKEALGQSELDPELIDKLPTVEDVTALYGTKPKIYGLQTCQQFQNSGINPAEHFVTTAGTFNTGTNLMADLLLGNCYMPERYKKYQSAGVRWQVSWGKHTPVYNETFRLTHHVHAPHNNKNNKQQADWDIDPNQMFPAVMIRDPFKWMQSMCRHQYAAEWSRDRRNSSHCPNLKPVSKRLRQLGQESVPVQVHYKKFTVNHTSLVDFWNDWYNDYVQATFPKLIVRFEDVIFYPKQVTKTICECAGGKLIHPNKFKYITDSAKKGAAHGKSSEKTSYVDALIKYGTEKGRYNGYYNEDIQYANEQLDSKLMTIFGYQYAPPPLPTTTTTSTVTALSTN